MLINLSLATGINYKARPLAQLPGTHAHMHRSTYNAATIDSIARNASNVATPMDINLGPVASREMLHDHEIAPQHSLENDSYLNIGSNSELRPNLAYLLNNTSTSDSGLRNFASMSISRGEVPIRDIPECTGTDQHPYTSLDDDEAAFLEDQGLGDFPHIHFKALKTIVRGMFDEVDKYSRKHKIPNNTLCMIVSTYNNSIRHIQSQLTLTLIPK